MSITASFTISRASGVAPMLVFFDATATTMDNAQSLGAFHECTFYWDFDDPSAGAWRWTGRSKNREVGSGLAAHVYETPGTYTPKLLVRDNNGNVAVVTGDEITVADPDAYYSGTNTICVSQDSDFTGAPDGASQVTSIPTEIASTNPGSRFGMTTPKRVLLRAGENFDALLYVPFSTANLTISRFGTGSNPIVRAIKGETGGLYAGFDTREHISDGLIVSEVDIRPQSLSDGGGNTPQYAKNCLWHKCKMKPAIQINGAGALLDPGITSFWHTYWDLNTENNSADFPLNKWGGVVDCWIEGSGITSSDLDYCVFATTFIQSAFMGNYVSKSYSHNFRSTMTHKALFSQNRITGLLDPTLSRLLFKLHTDYRWGDSAFTGVLTEGSEGRYITVQNNLLGDTNSGAVWYVVQGPQDTFKGEMLRDSVFRNNDTIEGVKGSSTYALRQIGFTSSAVGNRSRNSTIRIDQSDALADGYFVETVNDWGVDGDEADRLGMKTVLFNADRPEESLSPCFMG